MLLALSIEGEDRTRCETVVSCRSTGRRLTENSRPLLVLVRMINPFVPGNTHMCANVFIRNRIFFDRLEKLFIVC